MNKNTIYVVDMETGGLNTTSKALMTIVKKETRFFAQFKLDGKWWPAGEMGYADIEGCQNFIDIMETSALVSGGEVFEYRIKEEEV